MSWEQYAKILASDFHFEEKNLRNFLATQEAIWNEETCHQFLLQEYGEDYSRHPSPLIILPSNTPHLFLMEFNLCKQAKWMNPQFYVSSSNLNLKTLIRSLNFEVLDKLPFSAPHIRSYGKNKLMIECPLHLFHGPWIVSVDLDLLTDEKFNSVFEELEGRGCLTPTVVTGSEENLNRLPKLNHPSFEAQSYLLFIDSLVAAGLLKKKSDHIFEVLAKDGIDFLLTNNPPQLGIYFFIEKNLYQSLNHPRLKRIEEMQFPLRTQSEPFLVK